MKIGQQKRIDTPGQQQKVTLFGGYNWSDDTVNYIIHPKGDSEGFCIFIEQLMTVTYPEQFVILILDNASIHTSAMSQAILSFFEDRLLVLFLPKYSPFLNPIERYWQHLKLLANANRLHADLDALTTCLKQHLAFQNDPQSPFRLTFSKDL